MKGHGGVKASVRYTQRLCNHYGYVARFDIRSYYQIGILRGDGKSADVAGVKAIDGAPPEADSWVIATSLDAPELYQAALAAASEASVTYPDILNSIITRSKVPAYH